MCVGEECGRKEVISLYFLQEIFYFLTVLKFLVLIQLQSMLVSVSFNAYGHFFLQAFFRINF